VKRLALVLLSLSLAASAAGFKARGFTLPDGAVKVDEDRFRLPQTWEDALRFYKGAYPPAKFPRRTLHSESSVRAIHIANPAGGEWDGANLYESRGEVRVYVLPGKQQPSAKK
jgi:hypothetical protein